MIARIGTIAAILEIIWKPDQLGMNTYTHKQELILTMMMMTTMMTMIVMPAKCQIV